MKPTLTHNDTFVVDTDDGSIYEVRRPDRITYRLEPIIGNKILELDESSWNQHFSCGIFQYVSHG